MAASGAMNPFRCSGTDLPPNVLMMAKLIALALLLTNHQRLLPDPFLPFVPGLDRMLPGPVFQTLLKTVFLTSALALLFNRWVRVSCLLLGGSMLLAVLSSRAYYGNNKTFCALMLILAGLHVRGAEPRILRWQVALVYLGAGLNKALEPDWHSGQFFEHWAGTRLQQPVYQFLSSLFPPLVMGKMMCWLTIVLELSAAVLLAVPRWMKWGVIISVILQSGFLLFTGTTFTMFFYGMQAAMAVFLIWPQQPLKVIWDGTCGFCAWTKTQVERLDLEGVFQWLPYQSGEGRAHGITNEAAAQRMQLVTRTGKVLEGFHAFRHMLFYIPLFWFTLVALIALAPADASTWRRLVVATTLLFFSPLMNPIGVAAYDWVARNRYRIFPGGVCELPQSGER
ncbi:MAG: DCC1-like thiol-disulfide oxidoreductase family protein [Bryobacteraceae bacterium]|nr:DCC1-like thiol-disulfide oxidoreductase family protein [Bryobacteraceae bacterium]